jgi:hypothetical protein
MLPSERVEWEVSSGGGLFPWRRVALRTLAKHTHYSRTVTAVTSLSLPEGWVHLAYFDNLVSLGRKLVATPTRIRLLQTPAG